MPSSQKQVPSIVRTLPRTARIMAALLLVGLIGAYVFARADGVSLGPHQLERDRVSWVVFDEHTIGQVFRIDPAQMVGLRLWFTFPSGQTNGRVTARLRSYEHNRDIASTTVPITAIVADGATDLRFGRVDVTNWPSSEPLTVELIVSTEGVPEEHAIGLLGGLNRYSNGPLVIDGDQYPAEDLSFAALYQGSMFDMLLPITHLAAGRPGIFGWPPLYALLTWLMIWSALALLLAFATSTRELAIDPSTHS